VLVTVLVGAGLAGCGVGRTPQTYLERGLGDATNTGVGAVELRNISLVPPDGGDVHEEGSDVPVTLTITNSSDRADQLVAVTTDAAEEVEIVTESGAENAQIPAFGSTGGEVTLLLKELTAPVRTGEFVSMTFRFADSGTVEALIPVALTGMTDRPVYTGEEGSEEGEPALQAPTGGHGEEPAEPE
jgi:copper(I)-binding protein